MQGISSSSKFVEDTLSRWEHIQILDSQLIEFPIINNKTIFAIWFEPIRQELRMDCCSAKSAHPAKVPRAYPEEIALMPATICATVKVGLLPQVPGECETHGLGLYLEAAAEIPSPQTLRTHT